MLRWGHRFTTCSNQKKKIESNQCIDVRGDLSLVLEGVMCKCGDGTTQEADLPIGGWGTVWVCKELLLSGRHS